MQLYGSTLSPFARKVLVCARVRGIAELLAFVPTVAFDNPPVLLAANPLAKVPALRIDDTTALFDSPVICEYLDTHGSAPPLFPAAGPKRLAALQMQAAADGLMEAAVARRISSLAPRDAAREAFEARQAAAVARTLDWLEARAPTGLADIGAVAACCALSYLDFRFAHEDWRPGHPRLAAWRDAIADHPAVAASVPTA